MTQNKTTVTKFGGTSLADAKQVQKVVDILRSDDSRRFAVVSAPGKRSSDDIKLTDLLYQWCDGIHSGSKETATALSQVKQRFLDIAQVLLTESGEYEMYKTKLTNEFERYKTAVVAGPVENYVVSRGEYLMAQLMSQILRWEFVDATELIRFNSDGSCDWQASNDLIRKRFDGFSGKFVIPGFYGAEASGRYVRTFSRGGSDVSAAILAAGIDAALYENWSDTDGLMTAHPEVVPAAECVPSLLFIEAMNAACLGMNALHPDALYPLIEKNIPVVVKNTNNPEHPGTRIAADVLERSDRPVTMLAGRKDFMLLTVCKSPMFEMERAKVARTIHTVLKRQGAVREYPPMWSDGNSVVIDMKGTSVQTMVSCRTELERLCEADEVTLEDVSLLSVIGSNMAGQVGVAQKVISAITDAGVNIRIMNQGPSETGMLYGVSSADFSSALQAVHAACIK